MINQTDKQQRKYQTIEDNWQIGDISELYVDIRKERIRYKD